MTKTTSQLDAEIAEALLRTREAVTVRKKKTASWLEAVEGSRV